MKGRFLLGDVEGVTKGVWELQPGDVGELGAGESGKDSLPQLGEIEGWVGGANSTFSLDGVFWREMGPGARISWSEEESVTAGTK